MKRISLGAVYEAGLLAILLLVVLHAPISVWLGTIWPEQQTLIKAWKEILLAVLAIMAVVLITKAKLWQKVIHTPVILLAIAYIDLHLIMALVFGGEKVALVAGLMIDLRFIVIFILMYILVLLRPQSLRRIFMTTAVGAGIVIGFGLLQITVLPDDALKYIGYSKYETIAPYITIDANSDYVRINSTLRGPNPLGALLVVYITLALAYLLANYARAGVGRKTAAIGGSVAAAAVLFATYSRSAYGALVASVAVLVASSVRVSKRIWIAAGIVAACMAGLLLVTAQTDWFSNVILHENPESTVTSKSNDEHVQSLRVGLQRIVAEPFGHGIGSTGSASLYDANSSNDIIIENYYFFVAHEVGWLGLLLFAGLFGYAMVQLWLRKRDWRAIGLFASGIGLALIGLLLPVWTDDTVALVWWALAGALLATPVVNTNRRSKKALLQRVK